MLHAVYSGTIIDMNDEVFRLHNLRSSRAEFPNLPQHMANQPIGNTEEPLPLPVREFKSLSLL